MHIRPLMAGMPCLDLEVAAIVATSIASATGLLSLALDSEADVVGTSTLPGWLRRRGSALAASRYN